MNNKLDKYSDMLFESAKDIEEELKINANKIRKCCRENKKMVGGFKWEYMK